MAETSGFYDAEELVSGDYDREYVSEQFAQYFALFIGNGVYASPTNQLKVVAGGGMNIIVKEGWAFINGRWYHNDSDLVIPVPPNTTAATINSGVFVHHSGSDRDIHSILATGRTIPDREAPYWELKIAELQIPTGTTAITDAMIIDTRTDESVCGFVKNLLQGVIPTADLFAQYNAIFMDFYNHIKDQLSEDAAGHLQVEIDNLSDSIDNLSDSIAPQYDPSQTYGKGWVRMYNNKRYHSNQTITEPESWTPEHWTEESLDTALGEIKENSAVKVGGQITNYTSVENLAYDSTNKKLMLKVEGADTPFPFSSFNENATLVQEVKCDYPANRGTLNKTLDESGLYCVVITSGNLVTYGVSGGTPKLNNVPLTAMVKMFSYCNGASVYFFHADAGDVVYNYMSMSDPNAGFARTWLFKID